MGVRHLGVGVWGGILILLVWTLIKVESSSSSSNNNNNNNNKTGRKPPTIQNTVFFTMDPVKGAVTPIIPSAPKCSSRHFIFHQKCVCFE